jgi:serine O-acetyltransferase
VDDMSRTQVSTLLDSRGTQLEALTDQRENGAATESAPDESSRAWAYANDRHEAPAGGPRAFDRPADHLPPPRGDRNNNPRGLSLWALVREDFVTHDCDWMAPGFWALAVHRFGNWRMGFRWKLFRSPLTLVYRVLFHLVELIGGIMLPYSVPVGRRLRIWHHGGIVLHARAIGDDVHLRHNTTLGVARRGENWALPVIGHRVDIGCGACILGDVHVGDDSVIGANAVVTRDVPPWSVAVGIPARVVHTRTPAGHDGASCTSAPSDPASVRAA